MDEKKDGCEVALARCAVLATELAGDWYRRSEAYRSRAEKAEARAEKAEAALEAVEPDMEAVEEEREELRERRELLREQRIQLARATEALRERELLVSERAAENLADAEWTGSALEEALTKRQEAGELYAWVEGKAAEIDKREKAVAEREAAVAWLGRPAVITVEDVPANYVDGMKATRPSD